MVKDRLNLILLGLSIILGVVPNALVYKYYGIEIGVYFFDIVMFCFFLQSVFLNRLRVLWLDFTILSAFLLITIITLANVKHLLDYSSFLYLIRFVVYLLTYPIFIRLNYRGVLESFYKKIVLVVALFWLVVFMFFPDIRLAGFDPHVFRLYGPFLDPNYYSIFLCLGYFYFIFSAKSKQSIFIVALLILCIFLTFSRLGLLIFTFGNLFLALKIKNVALIGVLIGFSLTLLLNIRYILRFTFYSGHFDSFFYKVISFYEGVFLYSINLNAYGFNNIKVYRYYLMSNLNNVSSYFDFLPFNLLLTGGLVFIFVFVTFLIAYANNAKGIFSFLTFCMVIASFGMNILFNPIFFILLIVFVVLSLPLAKN